VIEGHLVLEAAADPVAADALGQLAAQLGKRGVRQVGGDVLADGPAAEQTKQPQPAFAGALGLCRRLGARGIAVSGVPRVGEAPGGAVVLADLSSPPLKSIIAGILKPSDNELAERLLVSLPWAAGRPELTPMELVGETWADRGLYLRPMRLADGSGLSRRNLMSPAFVVALLTYMHEQGRWSRAFEDALPLAGVDGTLAHRMRGTAAERQVQAKTGTLRGVSALSGYVRTQGEETLVFSIIMNNLTCPVSRARRMQDQICAALTELDRTGDRKN